MPRTDSAPTTQGDDPRCLAMIAFSGTKQAMTYEIWWFVLQELQRDFHQVSKQGMRAVEEVGLQRLTVCSRESMAAIGIRRSVEQLIAKRYLRNEWLSSWLGGLDILISNWGKKEGIHKEKIWLKQELQENTPIRNVENELHIGSNRA